MQSGEEFGAAEIRIIQSIRQIGALVPTHQFARLQTKQGEQLLEFLDAWWRAQVVDYPRHDAAFRQQFQRRAGF